MIWSSTVTVCRLEWRLLRRDAASSWAAILLLAVGVAALGLGEARDHQQRRQQAEIRRAEEAKVSRLRARASRLASDSPAMSERTLALERAWGARTPGYANAWTQLSALRQPAPLGMLAAGVSDLYPAGYGTSWRDVEPEAMPLDPREPMLSRAGWFDLAFVLVYLLPLAIVASTVDLVAREREAGTWSLIRSTPVSMRRIVAIKLVPRAALIAAVLVVLGALAAWRTGDAAGTVAWGMVTTAYAAFWFVGALLIGVSVRHAGTAVAAGCAAWFAIAMAVPIVVDAIVARTIPSPAAHALTIALRTARASIRFDNTEAQAAAALEAKDGQTRAIRANFLTRYPRYRDLDRLSTWGRYGIVQAAKEEALDALVAPLRRQREEAVSRREVWLSRLSWASPTLTVNRAFWRLADVDQRAQIDFQTQARAYDRQWKAFFWPLMFTGADFGPHDYDRMPRFTQRLPTADEQWSSAGAAAGLLLVHVAAVGALLWRATTR